MEFCPKCGSLMYPKKGEDKVELVCLSCGHKEKASDSEEYRLVKEGKRKEAPPVVEGGQEGLPKTKETCPECGHDEAYWWMQQTRGADEPTTRFYRCVKCNHVWREYS
ncbi:DNA-directed RNA polymerase subunit M [candidate division MSBL1 archaeon SCGC-AAA261G05]|uniref:Transcription factor S n=1 Tax=candidate division MSBL1 archaeon SCGC-AAA261G05 TaxID=1698276 RepID=A0A133VAB9_9EURY|nr:DNA-directed RNA polymerase subunit M [candidate division MSBL1 archaeon SCGC-AAA261G05]